jgi:hypothetical protein
MQQLNQQAGALSGDQAERRIFLVYLLVTFATHSGVLTGVRVWGALLVMAAIFLPDLTARWVYWMTLAFTMALDLTINYASQANHFWLALYTTLFFALACYRQEQDIPMAFNIPRALLVAVFGFATLQKMITPYFTSGRLLSDYFLRGSSLSVPLSWIYPGFSDTIQAYRDTHAGLAASEVLTGTSLPISLPGDSFVTLCMALTAGIILVEAAMFISMAVGKSFHHPAMPVLLLAFVWGTFLFRGEYSFFALLCYLFFLAQPRMAPLAKILTLLSMATFLALDAADAVTPLT